MKYEYKEIAGTTAECEKDLNAYGRIGYLLSKLSYTGQYADRYKAMLVREIGKSK